MLCITHPAEYTHLCIVGEYIQNHCIGAGCGVCAVLHPTCKGLPDGPNPYPGHGTTRNQGDGPVLTRHAITPLGGLPLSSSVSHLLIPIGELGGHLFPSGHTIGNPLDGHTIGNPTGNPINGKPSHTAYGDHSLVPLYVVCDQGRTLNVSRCTSGVFDPEGRLCVTPTDIGGVDGFCRRNPESVVPSLTNCAQFYACGDRNSFTGTYLHECVYPRLYDVSSGTCQDFWSVDCGDRPEPQAPCKFPVSSYLSHT